MSTNHTAEAQRALDEVEEQGAFHWRAGGQVPGERQRYVDEALKEALTEALAKVAAWEEEGSALTAITDEIRNYQKEIGDLALERFKDEIASAAESDPDRFPECVTDLVKALCDAVEEQRIEIDRLNGDGEPVAPTAKPKPVKRSKVGATTLALPFLTVAANEVDEPKRAAR